MRNRTTGLAAGLALSLAPSAAAQLTLVSNLPGTFVDISGTGTPLSLGDDAEVDIATTIGNPLLPAGIVRVGSNGAVRFRGPGSELAATNTPLPTLSLYSLQGQSLVPFWDDINTVGGTLGQIYWQETMGMLIVQWHDVSFFGAAGQGTARFQIQVPASGSTWARYIYPDITQARPNGGASATIGYQSGGVGNHVQFSLNTTGAVTDGSVLSLTGTFTPPPLPPANDDCGGAIPLALDVAAYFDNRWATTSATAFSCLNGTGDLWYRYTATSGNTLIASACGSTFNTIVDVLTGTCAGLTSIACNDDFCVTQSAVQWVGTVGTSYFIRVGGFNAHSTGSIFVTEAPPPSLTMVDNLPGTWIDISATGTALDLTDDGADDIWTNTGNSLFAAGTTRVGSNGCVRFAGAGQTLAFMNAAIPAAGVFSLDSQSLLGFWDDIDTQSGVVGNIYWQETQGRLIVQWQAAGFFSAPATETITFQIQVPGGAGDVKAQLLYQDVAGVRADNGGSATIGYQAGSVFNHNDVQWSFNTAGSVTNGTVLSLVMGAGGGVGTNYCTANVNSTGQTGLISGSGSASVAANNLTIATSRLPLNSFGYFVTSLTQASTPNPGGSQGVLCLGGSIGRYTGPGQIMNSGATGGFSLLLNLTQIPTPMGFVSAVVGQTRNFQSWHRDSVGGVTTSNFTNGLAVSFL
jgi:hypothetical protein